MSASTDELQWKGDDLTGMIVLEGELTAVTSDERETPQLSALVPA